MCSDDAPFHDLPMMTTDPACPYFPELNNLFNLMSLPDPSSTAPFSLPSPTAWQLPQTDAVAAAAVLPQVPQLVPAPAPSEAPSFGGAVLNLGMDNVISQTMDGPMEEEKEPTTGPSRSSSTQQLQRRQPLRSVKKRSSRKCPNLPERPKATYKLPRSVSS